MSIAGLPSLTDDVAVFQDIVLLTADALGLLGSTSQQQWGLFLNGEPAIVSDNVISFEYKQDHRVSNFPQEEGAFESYNKVQLPFDIRLRFSTGGSPADRQAMIDSIDAIIGSTDLFDAVTPEKVYESVNPVHQDLRRTAINGVGLLIIDVLCEQVRVTTSPQFSTSQNSSSGTNGDGTTTDITVRPGGTSQINQPQSASAAPQIDGGTVQSVPTSSGQFDLSQALQ